MRARLACQRVVATGARAHARLDTRPSLLRARTTAAPRGNAHSESSALCASLAHSHQGSCQSPSSSRHVRAARSQRCQTRCLPARAARIAQAQSARTQRGRYCNHSTLCALPRTLPSLRLQPTTAARGARPHCCVVVGQWSTQAARHAPTAAASHTHLSTPTRVCQPKDPRSSRSPPCVAMTRGARRCPLSAAAPGRSCCRRPAHQPVSSASSRFCVRRGSPRPRPRRHSAWRQDARGAAPAGQRQSVHWRHAGAHARARQGSRPRHRGARRHRASLLVVGVLALLAHFARRRTEREGEGPRPSHHRLRPRCPHAAARPRRATHALWRRCGAHDHPQSSPRAAARWRTKFGEAKKKREKRQHPRHPAHFLAASQAGGGHRQLRRRCDRRQRPRRRRRTHRRHGCPRLWPLALAAAAAAAPSPVFSC